MDQMTFSLNPLPKKARKEVCTAPNFWEASSIENGANMRKSPAVSAEVVERAVRMVFEAKDQYPSQWAAIESIAGNSGCKAETLHRWVSEGERASGARPGPTTGEQQRIKELEREVRELCGTNEMVKPASANFAQAEFDRQRQGAHEPHGAADGGAVSVPFN